jgi:hypothetical protein
LGSTSALDSENVQKNTILFSVVLPIVVVPNGRLWLAPFDEGGNQVGPVSQVDSIPYYIGHEYPFERLEECYVASHVDILTVDGLEALIRSFRDGPTLENFFPDDELRAIFGAVLAAFSTNF